MKNQSETAQANRLSESPNETVLSISGLRTCLATRKGKLYPVDGVDVVIPKGKIVGLGGREQDVEIA